MDRYAPSNPPKRDVTPSDQPKRRVAMADPSSGPLFELWEPEVGTFGKLPLRLKRF